MKKLILGFLIILSANVFAQQKGISYQAVIINPSDISAPGYNAVGTPLANKSVCMSFQILNAGSVAEYQETQTISTDQFGMVNLVIGNGTKTGGTAASLAAVTWSLGSKTLVVGVNTTGICSNYTEISRQVLNYVPFSMYADDANVKDGFITTAKLADGSVTDAKVALGINKTKVGLSNVDNTSDAAKPVSTATQTALDLKEDKANKSNDNNLGTSTTSYPTQAAVKAYVDAKTTAATTNISIATTEINTTQAGAGLAADGSYIANTSANYISSALSLADANNKLDTQLKLNTTAIGTKEDKANKSIDDKFLSTSNTSYPSTLAVKTYVDAQVAGATIADATATVKGKIQLAGDLGGTAAAPTVPALANKANISSLATVATSGSYNDLSNKPTIPAAYTLPNASASTLGGVKVGTNLSIDANGILNAAASGNYNDLTNKPTIPSAYTLPNASASALGGIKVGSNLSIDANGVLSGSSSYSLPNASASELGGVKVGAGLTITNGVLSTSGSGVPYTGATQAVDLGAFDLKVNGITVGRGNGNLASNTATGKDALLNNNTIGANNTAMGNQALYSNTFGSQNTAIGSGSLNSNINGIQNTAVGILSLEKNVGVSYNTAVGAEALRFTVDGESNTATGASALRANISGAYNSAFGRNALGKSTASFNNAAFGVEALADNLANGNTAYGAYALQRNTTGYSNTAVGIGAMKFQTTGNDNVAIGVNAGLFASNQTTGSNNTAVGAFAEYGAANLTNATVIGSGATVAASNTIQLGNTAVTNVKTSGTITAGAVTYPKVDGTAGQVLTANANGIPTWQPISAAPIVSPTFTGTPAAPTASAGTNTTQIATTEFVTGAIASATIADATTSAKGKIQLAGDLGGTAASPTVPGLALKANTSDVTTSLATKEDASNKSNAALGTSSTLFPTQNAVKTYVDAQVASATIADANATTKGKIQLAGDLGGTAAAPTVPGLALKAPIATPTFTGAVTAPIYASAPQNLTSSTAISWNPNAGLNANLTLAHNGTLSFTTAPTAGSYGTLVITQDATGGRTLTLPSGTNLVLGSTSTTTVTLSTEANVKDILNFYFDGTTYFWNIGKGFGTTATFTANNIAGGASGSILYQTGGGVTGFLARGTDGQILTLASGLPSWAAAPATGVTSATSPLSIASNAISLGTVPVANGGTGLTTAPANGQIDIGNGTGFARATLTAGTGVSITNGAGSITINASARSWTDQPTVSANQTTFTLTYAPTASSKIWMFINGVRTNNNAYSFSGTTVTYVPANNGAYAIAASDRVQFDYTY